MAQYVGAGADSMRVLGAGHGHLPWSEPAPTGWPGEWAMGSCVLEANYTSKAQAEQIFGTAKQKPWVC